MLHRIVLATAGVLTLTGAVQAADLTPPPPPPPIWTGFYVGVTAGGTWSGASSVDIAAVPFLDAGVVPGLGATSAALATGNYFVHPTAAFIGGGTLGYNYQFSPSIVAGIELDFSGVAADVRNAVVSTQALIPGSTDVLAQSIANSHNLDFLGTIRGRLGYLVTPTLLVYGTGGLAYGQEQANTVLTQFAAGADPALVAAGATSPYAVTGFAACSGFPAVTSCTYTTTRVGWTAGGGLEWLFTPNWSLKVEYLYYHLGSANYDVGFLQNTSNVTGTPLYASHVTSSVNFNGNVVRVGLNYKFYTWPEAGAPILPRY
ncbi:MAG TPA: outer membrane beta-barrel protein [Methylocella sp.]|nr:outer membrane beta-barrel protein [Methylocella sp.]